MKASYHYKLLAIVLAAGCASGERTTPTTEPAVVPPVEGAVVADAVDALQSAGLRAELRDGSTALPVTACAGGAVSAQDERPGTELVRGSTVVLTVSGCDVTASPS